jgi:hypothetical protein
MQYTIDADKITIRDLIALQSIGNDMQKQIDILKKAVIVEGGVFEDIPARHFKKIIASILQEMAPDSGN